MILFAGDSFSMYHTENCWTDVLAKKMNLGYWNHSLGGSSIWFAYTQIMKHKREIINYRFKYTVITCTSPQRIPFCRDESASHYVGNPASEKKFLTDEFNIDVLHFGYFERFYSRDCHNFLYKKVLEDLITKFNNYTKLILLPCFAESHSIVKDVFNYNPNFLYLNFPLISLYEENYNQTNHLTPKTNLLFGNLLGDGILNQNIGPFTITEQNIGDLLK